MLDEYRKATISQQREFAITKTIEREIGKGPLAKELLDYLSDRQVTVLSTPQLEQQLLEGTHSAKNAGEVSVMEVVAKEHASGRETRI